MPLKPRKSAFGRLTHWTGSRNGALGSSPWISTVSRMSISGGPAYQGMAPCLVNTPSPVRAESGTQRTSSKPMPAAKAR